MKTIPWRQRRQQAQLSWQQWEDQKRAEKPAKAAACPRAARIRKRARGMGAVASKPDIVVVLVSRRREPEPSAFPGVRAAGWV